MKHGKTCVMELLGWKTHCLSRKSFLIHLRRLELIYFSVILDEEDCFNEECQKILSVRYKVRKCMLQNWNDANINKYYKIQEKIEEHLKGTQQQERSS